MVYTLRFFSSKCSLFHNSNVFVSCIIHILYRECAKIKKNNSGSNRLIDRTVLWERTLFSTKPELSILYDFHKLQPSKDSKQTEHRDFRFLLLYIFKQRDVCVCVCVCVRRLDLDLSFVSLCNNSCN